MFRQFSPRYLILASLLLLLSGCSSEVFHTTSPEVKQTLIGITNRYLTLVAKGDEHQVTQLIYWPDFSNGGKFTTSEFHSQFEAMRSRWAPQNNPLIGLVVLNASASGNSAKVTLQRDPKLAQKGATEIPEIWVKLIWAGRGWIVSEDSLFGSDKYFSTLTKTKG